jgi:hypothetical protein
MANKNAYEIRLEVLKLAKDMADGQYYAAVEVATDKTQITDNRESETLRLADQFYKFVENS